MNTWAKTLFITLLIILVGGGLLLFALKTDEPVDNIIPVATSTNEMIVVTSPKGGESVKSPLIVTGKARGGWYFEASFPLKVLDADGKVLGTHYAEAQTDWMTNEFVVFVGNISFTPSSTETGTLVLEKDNPSGLPENDASIRVPIRFSQVATSTQTREAKLYFYNQTKDLDASGNILCSSKGLVALDRKIPFSNTPIQDAVRELLKGPTQLEKVQTPGTEFPLAGVELKSASVNGTILTLSLADPQNKTSGGSCRVSILRAQIEKTAKQFGGVTEVRFKEENLFQP